jgi:hypothetical protein
MQTTTTAITLPPAPEGLLVEPCQPNRLGLVYRASCTAHPYCRDITGMRWMANSWEDFTDRVTPAFHQHCQDMQQYT